MKKFFIIIALLCPLMILTHSVKLTDTTKPGKQGYAYPPKGSLSFSNLGGQLNYVPSSTLNIKAADSDFTVKLIDGVFPTYTAQYEGITTPGFVPLYTHHVKCYPSRSWCQLEQSTFLKNQIIKDLEQRYKRIHPKTARRGGNTVLFKKK